MRRKKHAPINDAAESTSSRETDSEMAKEEARIRRRMEQIRLELASLGYSDEDDLARNTIKNLKMLNKMLLKELTDEIENLERFRSEVESLEADQEALSAVEREVFGTVFYSSFGEAAESWTEIMAASMEAPVSL